MQDEIRKMIQQRDFLQSQLNSVLKQMESMEQGRQLVSHINNCRACLSMIICHDAYISDLLRRQ